MTEEGRTCIINCEDGSISGEDFRDASVEARGAGGVVLYGGLEELGERGWEMSA